MSSTLTASTSRKDKPIGGGHTLEKCSELTTRVGSTPTPSAKTERITMVGLLALEARGCRFESCLLDNLESRQILVCCAYLLSKSA